MIFIINLIKYNCILALYKNFLEIVKNGRIKKEWSIKGIIVKVNY